MSRDPKRIRPLLDRLEKVWMNCPDQRLGQLIANSENGWGSCYVMECEEIIENLEKLFIDSKPKSE
jgi:hypothetical protein